MQVLHEDLQIKDFEMPAGVEELTYCTKTGLIATSHCEKTDKGVYKTDFKPDTCTCGTEEEERPDPVIPTLPTPPTSTPVTGNTTTIGGETDGTQNTASTTVPSVPTTEATVPVAPDEEDNP